MTERVFLLTDGEIKEVTETGNEIYSGVLDIHRAVAKAQLRKIWDRLTEPCKEHPTNVDLLMERQRCPECMREFKEELD